MTIEDAIRQIRRQAGRLNTTFKGLEQIQSDLVSASVDALREVAAGGRPLTVEAHLVVAVQKALLEMETLHWNLRDAARKQTLRLVEEDRKAGNFAAKAEREYISAALEALRG